MANRILRDWTDSETMDSLSEGAEIFFTRLIMRVDDFGCFHGNPKLLNSALYPLKGYSPDKVLKWRNECAKAGVIQIYQVSGKEYVKIFEFKQRLRLMNSKFPQPSDDGQLTVNCQTVDNIPPPETKRSRNEVETETEDETNTADAVVDVWPSFEDFWIKYDKKTGKPKAEELWKKINQGAREKIMANLDHYTLKDKQYRKDPERYLKHRTWEDEVILTNTPKQQQNGTRLDPQATLDRLNSYT